MAQVLEAQVFEIMLAQARPACIQRLRENLECARMQAAEHETRMDVLCNFWHSAYQHEMRTTDRVYSMLWASEAHATLLATRLRELGHPIPAAPRSSLPFDFSDTESDMSDTPLQPFAS